MAGKTVSRSQARKILTRLRNELEGGGDVSHLNITAMMDMMSILLVFMLMQFAAEQASMQTSDNLVLAKSNAPLKPIPSLNVTVSTTAIIVEGDAIAAVRQGANGLSAVDPAVKRDGPNGYYITPLVDTLTKHANRLKKLEALTGGKQKFDGTMLLLVDKDTPYRLVTEVLYSAGQAQFANYRMVVTQSSE